MNQTRVFSAGTSSIVRSVKAYNVLFGRCSSSAREHNLPRVFTIGLTLNFSSVTLCFEKGRGVLQAKVSFTAAIFSSCGREFLALFHVHVEEGKRPPPPKIRFI